MAGTQRNIFSFLVLLIFAGTIVISNIIHPPKNVLTYDTFGYYLYLPGTFIYRQLEYSDQSDLERLNEKYKITSTFYQFVRAPNMKYLNKYSMGLAFLYLPFFLLAHLVALLGGYPPDGLSPPYQILLVSGAFIYSITGVFVLRKILLRYLSDIQAGVTLALLIFGTNYIYDAAFKGLMPHNMLFTVYAFLIWFTIRYYESHKTRYAVLIGLTAGLLTLARPSEIVCLFIPLFWGITGKDSLKERMQYWRINFRHLLIAGICFLLIWIPQMIYWKSITGHFLFYSYDNPGEGFDFLAPHTFQVLFSFRKGWLIYTPMMIFALIGFFYLFRKNRGVFWPVLMFFVLNLYLVSSWSCWWYAESYGQRALIQSYAVMALPLGFFVQNLMESRKSYLKASFFILFILLILFNGFQIWQLRHGILDASRMTGAYYFSTFGQTTGPTDDQKKLLIVQRPSTSREFLDNENDFNRQDLAILNFEDRQKDRGERKAHYDSLVVHAGKYSFRMDSLWGYSPGFDIKYRDFMKKDYAWIRASVDVFPTADIKTNDALLVISSVHGGRYYKYRGVRMSEPEFNVVHGQWNRITMDYITPEIRSRRDGISIYVWYQGKEPLYVDDLKIEVFEEKF